METKNLELDVEAAALIAEAELLEHVVKPSGGEDGRKYEIYASRCPSKK
ncbi:hypothetical protein [Brevibacterium otitidis]|uniref:Uncharacterized protein n=1 Tax=Brevibacterium otitidis TaxID=53364 RepID=A0ABV5X640_9MICO|nr:hypothetical protein GCM10023233_30470 [Brevibacterium otitidis]